MVDKRKRIDDKLHNEIIRLYNEGNSTKSISKILGIGSSSVCRHLKKAKVKIRDQATSEEKKLLFIDLYSAGTPISEIRKIAGISTSVQHRIRKELGLPYRNRAAKRDAFENIGRKYCGGKNGCGKMRPLESFYLRKDRGTYDAHCKKCRRKMQTERQKTEEFKKWNSARTLNKTYGITIDDYHKMESEQNGVCKICGQPNTNKRTNRLFVDHCHATGRIRGLLCGTCNTGIGNLKDSPDILRKAIAYLESN